MSSAEEQLKAEVARLRRRVAEVERGERGRIEELRQSQALYRALVDRGAIALTVPAAFTLTTGKDHWHVLLRARAIEAQCYVIAAAQFGHHYGPRVSYGHALIADPWGTVLAECGDGEGFAIARIDPTEVERVRGAVPSLKHRRL